MIRSSFLHISRRSAASVMHFPRGQSSRLSSLCPVLLKKVSVILLIPKLCEVFWPLNDLQCIKNAPHSITGLLVSTWGCTDLSLLSLREISSWNPNLGVCGPQSHYFDAFNRRPSSSCSDPIWASSSLWKGRMGRSKCEGVVLHV